MAEDGLAPLTSTKSVELIALTAEVDATVTVATAPFAGVVERVSYSPTAAVAGKATNYRTLSVTNKGAAAAGTNVVASLALSAAERSLVAYEENTIPLSGEAAKLVVAEGDELVFGSVHTGTGLADPGGLVSITFKRT
jgi:hypothetical protein